SELMTPGPLTATHRHGSASRPSGTTEPSQSFTQKPASRRAARRSRTARAALSRARSENGKGNILSSSVTGRVADRSDCGQTRGNASIPPDDALAEDRCPATLRKFRHDGTYRSRQVQQESKVAGWPPHFLIAYSLSP